MQKSEPQIKPKSMTKKAIVADLDLLWLSFDDLTHDINQLKALITQIDSIKRHISEMETKISAEVNKIKCSQSRLSYLVNWLRNNKQHI